MLNTTTKAGLEFKDLAKGLEKNYSCSFLVNLDHDLMHLIMPGRNFIDAARDVLIGHTERIFQQINERQVKYKNRHRYDFVRSGSNIAQYCFGSTHLQLNTNYRRLDRMDHLTWKKEGISSAWCGARGLRKSCCKVCCSDTQCGGCRECLCRQGPVRGLYDGLVVLTCVTRQSLPKASLVKMNQEDLAVSLEHSLTVLCMQADSELGRTIVHTGRDRFTPELQSKKHPAYCVCVAYRLDRSSDRLGSGGSSLAEGSELEDEDEEDDEDTFQVMEELEDKELVSRLSTLEEVLHDYNTTCMIIYRTYLILELSRRTEHCVRWLLN